MSRFDKARPALLARSTARSSFDWRLAPYDIDQSRPTRAALRETGVLDDDELRRARRRPRARSPAELGAGGFEFERGRRGHPHGDRAAARPRSSARSPASSTPAARATTRSPPTWRWSSRRTRCGAIELSAALMERLLELAERHRDWPMPGYTHLQRAQPVYLGHHLLAYFWMLAPRRRCASRSRSTAPRDAARLRRARRASTGRSTARRRRRPRLRARQPQLDRRRLQPRLRPRLPLRGRRSARCTSRGSARRS